MNPRVASLATLPLAAALGFAAICGDGSSPRSGAPDAANTPVDEWIDAFPGSTFSGRYAFSGGEDGFEGEGTVTIHKKGADHIRIDMHFTLTGEGAADAAEFATTDISVIQTPGESALCVDQPGIFGIFGLAKEKSCIHPDDLGDDSGFDDDPFKALSPDNVDRDEYTEDTIAGHAARCYEAPPEATRVPEATPASGDYNSIERGTELAQRPERACFSREGWLLRITDSEITSGADTVADVEDLTGDVPDSTFDLPYPIFKPESLDIRNNSDVTVFVQAHSSDDLSGIISDSVEVKPHDSGTLKAGVTDDPKVVAYGTYDVPQWQWTCSWDDAKAHEPLVIGDDTSNCPDAKRVDGWSPYPEDAPEE